MIASAWYWVVPHDRYGYVLAQSATEGALIGKCASGPFKRKVEALRALKVLKSGE